MVKYELVVYKKGDTYRTALVRDNHFEAGGESFNARDGAFYESLADLARQAHIAVEDLPIRTSNKIRTKDNKPIDGVPTVKVPENEIEDIIDVIFGIGDPDDNENSAR